MGLAPWPSTKSTVFSTTGDFCRRLFQGFSMTSCFGTQGAQLQGHHCSGQAPWGVGERNPSVETDVTRGAPRFACFDFFRKLGWGFSLCHWNFYHADFTKKPQLLSPKTFHDSIFNSACNRTRFNLFGANSISPSQAIGGCPHHGSGAQLWNIGVPTRHLGIDAV